MTQKRQACLQRKSEQQDSPSPLLKRLEEMQIISSMRRLRLHAQQGLYIAFHQSQG